MPAPSTPPPAVQQHLHCSCICYYRTVLPPQPPQCRISAEAKCSHLYSGHFSSGSISERKVPAVLFPFSVHLRDKNWCLYCDIPCHRYRLPSPLKCSFLRNNPPHPAGNYSLAAKRSLITCLLPLSLSPLHVASIKRLQNKPPHVKLMIIIPKQPTRTHTHTHTSHRT